MARLNLDGAVRREARATIVDVVPTFDQEHFVGRHLRCVIPSLRGRVSDVVDFTDAIGENLICGDEIVLGHARRVGESKRRALDGPTDRTPYVYLDDPGTGGGETFGFRGAKNVL